MSKGSRANKRGRRLENAVSDLLSEEYERVSSGRFFAMHELRQPIFAEQCSVGRDIYSTNRRVDFILYHPQRGDVKKLVETCISDSWSCSRFTP